jgi:hypothetical protein
VNRRKRDDGEEQRNDRAYGESPTKLDMFDYVGA